MEKFQLGTFLRNEREGQNLSTRDLAERTQAKGSDTSVTASQINRIENNKVSPTFHTLQRIVESLDTSLVIILDGSKANPAAVTVVSTEDVSESLLHALHRTELVQLLMYCQELTDEQVMAILGVARSIRGFTRSIDKAEKQAE